MTQFQVEILKHPSCDETIEEILESVEFQNRLGNLLKIHQKDATKVTLVYEGP
jgi:hypothetical protein